MADCDRAPLLETANTAADLRTFDRRSLFHLAGAGITLSIIGASPKAKAATAAPTMLVVAAPNTPRTADLEGPELGDVESQSTIMCCYDGLIEFKFKDYPDGHREAIAGEFQPRLAKSWRSVDATTWRFDLVEGVKSQYGNEFTSADILYLWNVYNPGRNNLGAFFKNQIAKITAVRAIGKYAVEFTTDGPAPMFLQVMTTAWSRPFDRVELKKHQSDADPLGANWLNRNVAGYGPYEISDWEPDARFIMKRRNDYYGPTPYLSEVIWVEVPDASNRLSLLLNGQVQAARELQFDDLQKVADHKKLHVESAGGNFGLYLMLDFKTKPFDDVRVRQAVAYAVPYDAIIEKVFSGYATPLKSVEVPAYEGYTEDYWHYATNLDSARKLIQEAGAAGTTVELSYTAAKPQHEAVAIALQTSAAKIGINFKLRKMPAAAFTAAAIQAGMPAFLHDTYAWVVPTTAYDLLLSKVTHAPNNHVRYSNPTIDELATKLAGEPDLTTRLSMARQAQKIMMNELPWIPICNEGQHEAFVSSLTGMTWVPHGVFLAEYLVPAAPAGE
jgi:peptide/nickel transport system substrate-binding protein